MRSFTVDELAKAPFDFLGAPDLEITADGLGPRRLPAWTRSQIPDLFMDAMVSMGSGVRIRFRTDSNVIELDAIVTCVRYLAGPTPTQTVQLIVDGDIAGAINAIATTPSVFELDPENAANIGFTLGSTDTLRFDLPRAPRDSEFRVCELWLPHGGTTRITALRVADGATVESAGPTGKSRWIHYGSSISHCIEAEVPTGVWPAIAADLAGVELRSLGLAGQCMIDQFVARTIRDEAADLISLKLGINIVNGDTMRERTFSSAVNGFLDTVRDGHSDTPILIVSPIWCPSAETVPGPTLKVGPVFVTVPGHDVIRAGCLTLSRIREILATIVETRRSLGDANLHYLDGLRLFGEADEADLPDALHPNPAGYRRMGERFAELAFGPEGALAR